MESRKARPALRLRPALRRAGKTRDAPVTTRAGLWARRNNGLGEASMGRSVAAAIAAAAVAVLGVTGAASGQNFPAKPVTLIVPWPAGGSTDLVLRSLANATQKHLGQSIVIENRPGAGGA